MILLTQLNDRILNIPMESFLGITVKEDANKFKVILASKPIPLLTADLSTPEKYTLAILDSMDEALGLIKDIFALLCTQISECQMELHINIYSILKHGVIYEDDE